MNGKRTGMDRVRRLLVGTAAAALAAVIAPSGTAAAATPAATAPAAITQAAITPAALSQQVPAPAPRPATAAAAAQRARTSWEAHGRPRQLVIVRVGTVDLVSDGVLTRRTVRSGGALTLTRLDRYLPAGWLTIDRGVARLSAAVVLTPGTALDLGGDVTTLQLAGGATAPEAASLYTGGGRLTVHDVTVTSVDAATQQAVVPGPGRPVVMVAPGGRLDATDATFSDLGTPAIDLGSTAGVEFNPGGSGSLVRTSLLRNSTGLTLDGAVGVRLDGVTVADSAADGLVLRGDSGTTMAGVSVERNAGNGVLVNGPTTDRPVSGVTTQGNGQWGVAVVGQTAPRLTGLVTQADGEGGLRLARSSGATVTGFSAVDEPIGVLAHLASSQVVLDQLRVQGGQRGVEVDKTVDGLTLTSSTIERSAMGMSVAGRNVELRDVAVGASGTGVRVERGSAGISATRLTFSGGTDGFVAIAGTSGVVLRDMVADGVANDAVRTASPDAQIIGGRISGSTTGIDAEAATSISGTEINQVKVGIRARSADLVAAQDVDVSAVTSGINVTDGSSFTLTDSRVDALEAVDGQADLEGLNDLSLPPLNVLGAIGIPLILLALLLDQVQKFRQRPTGGDRRRRPPSLRAG